MANRKDDERLERVLYAYENEDPENSIYHFQSNCVGRARHCESYKLVPKPAYRRQTKYCCRTQTAVWLVLIFLAFAAIVGITIFCTKNLSENSAGDKSSNGSLRDAPTNATDEGWLSDLGNDTTDPSNVVQAVMQHPGAKNTGQFSETSRTNPNQVSIIQAKSDCSLIVCHKNATCLDGICTCLVGFQGDGKTCTLVPSLEYMMNNTTDSSDATPSTRHSGAGIIQRLPDTGPILRPPPVIIQATSDWIEEDKKSFPDKDIFLHPFNWTEAIMHPENNTIQLMPETGWTIPNPVTIFQPTSDCSQTVCHTDATCLDGVCTCSAGFSGDGITTCLPPPPHPRLCQPEQNIRLRSKTCGCNSHCVNNATLGVHTCECQKGYERRKGVDSASRCVDIDECSLGTAHCPADSRCFNIAGGYRCLASPSTNRRRNIPKI